MIFSLTSFFTIMFFSNFLIMLVWLSLKKTWLMKRVGMSTIFFCIGFIVVRLLIPFEFSFSNNLAFKWILPKVVFFFETPIINVGKLNISPRQIMFFIFGVGIFVQLRRTYKSYYNFKTSIDRSNVMTNIRIQHILHKVLLKYKKSVSFNLLQTDSISIPMMFGLRNPIIMIPQIELTDDEWYHILNHEVAHYYHKDLWIKLLIESLCIIYWWNPFIYLLKKQISKVIEIHVDLTITKQMCEKERIEYLECLLKIAKKYVYKESNKLALAFGSGSSCTLRQRFNMVLENCNKSIKANFKIIFLTISIVLFLVCLSIFWVFEPYSISPQVESYTVSLTEENAYLVHNKENCYDLYIDDQYFGTVNDIKDSYSNLHIYNSLSELIK